MPGTQPAGTKVLFHSNAPWAPTGYGQQTGLFAPMLAEHYDLAVSSFYGLEGARLNWEGVPVYPGIGQDFGNIVLPHHARSHFGGELRDGIVLSLMDVWVLDAAMCSGFNMACWTPVDHEPAPPRVLQFFHRSEAVPIAMSRFGQEQLKNAGLDALYVPHGVNADVYRPYDRTDVRKQVGLPKDAFLVGMVAANKGRPSRKGFQQAFEAFARFRQRHDDAYLYLHTMVEPNFAEGENIPQLLGALGIPPESVLIAEQYRVAFDPHPAKSMARIYSSMDVLLNPAMGEGFGVPVLEAQACGVPAIVTDFSAMKEVCGAGWHVECRPFWSGQNSWMAVADVEDIHSALESCYNLPKSVRKQLSEKARRHALTYKAETVLEEHFLPALAEVERRFADRQPVRLKAAA